MTLSDLLEDRRRYVMPADSTIKITPDCWARARAFYEVPDDVSDDEVRRWAFSEIQDAAERSTIGALRLICVVTYVGPETEITVASCLQIISLVANGSTVDEAVKTFNPDSFAARDLTQLKETK